jgi:hypothetical protein
MNRILLTLITHERSFQHGRPGQTSACCSEQEDSDEWTHQSCGSDEAFSWPQLDIALVKRNESSRTQDPSPSDLDLHAS